QDELLALFDTEDTGSDFQLTPATEVDMCAASKLNKPSLEVVYDEV
ncbi:MAG: chlorophyllide reductase iron protein subunit X, partial [Pseudomonadota bacterium]